MIFRTGSVLIVGKCNDNILNNIYIKIKELLCNEFYNISTHIVENNKENKIKKIRKKNILVSC